MSETTLPAWLQAKVDQRMALVAEAVPAADWPVIVTPLSEAPEDATPEQRRRWDRTCDCCGRYCPYPREDFYTGQLQRTRPDGVLVLMFFGVCKEHNHEL